MNKYYMDPNKIYAVHFKMLLNFTQEKLITCS